MECDSSRSWCGTRKRSTSGPWRKILWHLQHCGFGWDHSFSNSSQAAYRICQCQCRHWWQVWQHYRILSNELKHWNAEVENKYYWMFANEVFEVVLKKDLPTGTTVIDSIWAVKKKNKGTLLVKWMQEASSNLKDSTMTAKQWLRLFWHSWLWQAW